MFPEGLLCLFEWDAASLFELLLGRFPAHLSAVRSYCCRSDLFSHLLEVGIFGQELMAP